MALIRRLIRLLLLLSLHCRWLTTALPAVEEAAVELDVLSCPSSCVCQYAAFNELPIARWVNHMTSLDESLDAAEYLLPSHIKLATCLLQQATETQALLSALPIDLNALILLHTGQADNQLTVNTSSLRPLNQLITLEIRGTGATTLIIDEPLEYLQHANFEQINLQASDRLERPKYSKLPSDDYEYKPPSEVLEDNEATPKSQLQFEAETQPEIMTYEQHVERLKQTRMPSFYGWSRLEVLRIHNCRLQELHWQIFDGLGALHHLSLERNGIEELQPFAFSGALHLKSLSLAHNALSRLHYMGLAGLLQLEQLNLAHNYLERLSEVSFPPLPRLQKADLRQNPVRNIWPATFWVMNNTKELLLGSELAALELRSFSNYGQFDSLHKLRSLSLSNVSSVNLEQNVFKGLHSLESLTLRGRIASVQFDAFAGLEQLRELDLSNCSIVELSMDAFMGLKRLEQLQLAHNNLSSLPNGLLDDLLQLESLQLQGNQLHTLPSSFFLQRRLRVARLDQNPWECSCDMRHWLPRLTNVRRMGSEQRCMRDLQGEQINCRSVASYQQDKSLVPRCANYNGRSVYYVLRKQLHCDSMLILHTQSSSSSTRGLPHWRKQQLQAAGGKHNKQQLRKVQRNSLEFALKQQQKTETFNTQQMSNEI